MAIRERDETGRDRMIQGRLWMERVPPQERRAEVAEQRYEVWTRLHPRLFDARRYGRGPAPRNVGKGCMVCLMDTRDTSLQRCPRCGRRLIWVWFEEMPY